MIETITLKEISEALAAIRTEDPDSEFDQFIDTMVAGINQKGEVRNLIDKAILNPSEDMLAKFGWVLAVGVLIGIRIESARVMRGFFDDLRE